MKDKFHFIEWSSGRRFFARKVIQTDGSIAYAITWVEDDEVKVELYTIKEVSRKIQLESWGITDKK
ncbi:hypothetical protein CN918_29150 [Priestia megaterium]|nr:hypothetical protein CN918_29150 [Priestia megaterium]